MAQEDPKIKTGEWQTQLNAINDAVLIVDHDRTVLRANRTAKKFFNLPITEMVGKRCREILNCGDNSLYECPYLRAKESSSRENSEFFRNNNWFQVTVDPVLDEDSRFTGAVLIFKDVTISRQAENSLREKEQKFRILAENPIVGIFISQDKKFIYVNDRLAEMHGYSKEEIIGQPFYILVHPDERDTLKERMDMQLALGDKHRHRYEMLRIRKNGETFWGGAIVTRGKYNGKNAIFGSVIDISESKQAEEELKKSKERYREIVEDSDDLIIKVDHHTGNIVFANHMASRIFGLPQSDIIGMHISKCIHPDDRDKTRKLIDETVANKRTSATFENRLTCQTGEIRHLLWTSNFHYDSDGNLIEITSIARDITMRRKMEEALKKAYEDLELRVKERTRELEKANKELHEKTNSLEELNTALKILLDRREKDKEENGEKILLNVKELLMPYISKLKIGPLNENQKNYVELLDSGLQEIISPFAQKLTSRYMHITPRELQVGNFVKQGKTSKEIADILNTTERTVVAHRSNLRKKLGLGKKSNLRTYLLSLQ